VVARKQTDILFFVTPSFLAGSNQADAQLCHRYEPCIFSSIANFLISLLIYNDWAPVDVEALQSSSFLCLLTSSLVSHMHA